MRRDLRPYWLKKAYLRFRYWYAEHFLRPACDYLGAYHNIMKPWYVSISGPNVRIGRCVTMVAEPHERIKIGVWGREEGKGEISIGDNVLISPGVRISASDRITIGDSVMFANGVYVTDSDWHGIYNRNERSPEIQPVKIDDNAWLGDRCTVLKGVTIGENSIVAAAAVVTKDVPANVIVAGNPAVVVKTLDEGQGYVTRADFFKDPAGQQQFFDEVDKEVLASNSFFNWLRALLFPNKSD